MISILLQALKRILFILVAFSILNQSIDLDYITANFNHSLATNSYDDIDSITELLVETLLNEEDVMPEDYHDDNGIPQHNGVVKFAWNPLISHTASLEPEIDENLAVSKHPIHLLPVHHTCKGYGNIVSPPPDSAA